MTLRSICAIALPPAVEAARHAFDVRVTVDARDAQQVVAPERLALVHATDGARSNADDGNAAAAGLGDAREVGVHVAVIVSVQHELGAARSEDGRQRARIAQCPPRWRLAGERRMMNQHHANEPFRLELRQQLVQRVELRLANLAGGNERRRLDGRVEADERDGADAAHEGKPHGRPCIELGAEGVGAHVVGPQLDARIAAQRRIDVVVTRHDGHVMRRADLVQPCGRRLVLSGQPQVDEIAGDGDMIGLVRQHVGHDEIERRAVVRAAALALPIDVAEAALDVEMTQRNSRHRRKMHIRHVGKRDRFAHRGLGMVDRR